MQSVLNWFTNPANAAASHAIWAVVVTVCLPWAGKQIGKVVDAWVRNIDAKTAALRPDKADSSAK